jgi:hypothetical protein
MPPRKRYRCRYCWSILPARLPIAKRPEGSMLLYQLGQHHPDQVGPHLERMRTECITTVVVEGFEVVEEDRTR